MRITYAEEPAKTCFEDARANAQQGLFQGKPLHAEIVTVERAEDR